VKNTDQESDKISEADPLDRLLAKASQPRDNPWFVTRTLQAVRENRSRSTGLLAGLQSGLRQILLRPAAGVVAVAIVAAGLLLHFQSTPPGELPTHATSITISEEDVLLDLDFLFADYQTELWIEGYSSL